MENWATLKLSTATFGKVCRYLGSEFLATLVLTICLRWTIVYPSLRLENSNCLWWTIVYPSLRFGMCWKKNSRELNVFLSCCGRQLFTVILKKTWYTCMWSSPRNSKNCCGGQLSTLDQIWYVLWNSLIFFTIYLQWTIVYPSLRFGMCCEITKEINKLLRWTIVYPRPWYI